VLLAIYVSVGRLLSSLSGAYQNEILQEMNRRVPFIMDADRVTAEWHSFSPVLVLDGLRLTLPGEAERSVELSEGRITLDVASSVFTRSPQMTRLQLKGLDLAGELGVDGSLRIRGFDGGDTRLGEWLEDFLGNVERVALDDIHLELQLPGGEQRGFDLDLVLSREGSRRLLEGSLSSSRGLLVTALAEGVGNPFDPGTFAGQLYLDVGAVDAGAIADLLGERSGGLLLDGTVSLQLWSNWDRGEQEALLRLEMNDLLLSRADAPWQLPLERLALDARLERREDAWAIAVADLEMARNGTLVRIPRLQLDLRGETLDLRAQALALGPFSELLAGSRDALPAAAIDLLNTLKPRGVLSAVQLEVADITAPAAGWQLRANFEQLVVDSWHGAPGVSGARGYTELGPGTGHVVLDSQQFSMAFPTVYEQTLDYEDFQGTIHLYWDARSVELSSGLVEVLGAEGPVRVLFGLSIPLVPSVTGLEMDLLVGLEGIQAAHRGKYIPYILSEELRPWLAGSIGDGMIEQGGFLWRGSLEPDAPQHHTVQLFFNVRDTALDYHPDWPPLADIAGTVLIDDAAASVWADSASLLDSRVSKLSVEVWPDANDALWLAVDGSLAGPAADGLAVINNSPLGGLTAGTFSDWQLTGELATGIRLLLSLTDNAVAPRVSVTTRFLGTDLDIQPGQLPLRGISGVLDYDSEAGFSSSDLQGELWGRSFQAGVAQRTPAAGEGEQRVVAVSLAGTVEMSSIRKWLDLDLLAFADGRAAVALELLAGAGIAPVMSLDSTLQGVSLDLLEPWGKAAATARPLRLELALGSDQLQLGLALEGGLALDLGLQDGKLQAAALAFDVAPSGLRPGLLQVNGRTALVDAAQWQRFLADYFFAAADQSAGGEAGGEAGAEREGTALALSIDQLRVDRLVVAGQAIADVLLSVAEETDGRRVTAATDWLRGELLYSEGDSSSLAIDYLDLAGLEALELSAGNGSRIIEVPALAVTVNELRRGDTPLGRLSFDLRSEGAELRAENISGEIAALQLRSEEPGELSWLQGPDSHTALRGRLHFSDLGQTLERLGYQEAIVTDEGSLDLSLEWPGAPQDFALERSRGQLEVDIGRGHFPQAPGGASGALRVVSILNLAEIVQRLSLTQMFESGIPFNEVTGEVLFQAGTIEVPQMNVQGTASSFQFSGNSGVQSRALDGELVVTLPVASNLPWVAALAGGLPVAAGVFLISKVFESQFNRLTSAVYTVSGSWDDPEVEFDRVFDDTDAVIPGAAGAGPGPGKAVPDGAVPLQSESP
jgi:uncharacterized protein (TIGR02099 family)